MTQSNDSQSEQVPEEVSEEIVKEIVLGSPETRSMHETPKEEVNSETNQDNIQDTSLNKSIKIVEKKPITKLTDEERAIILKNYSEGIDQPYFSVKQFKNGNYKIIKKKPTQPSVSGYAMRQISDLTPEKVISSNKTEEEPENSQKQNPSK